MEISPQENNSWKSSQSEQVFWYGESHPRQNTLPVYTQSGQYQQPNQAYWNPNTDFSNPPFASAMSPTVQQKLRVPQGPRLLARMPKAQAQSLARNLKRGVLVSSFAAFGVLSVLVASNLHLASATPSFPNQVTDPSPSNANDPSAGNYFNQGGGGGNGFGNNNTSQNPGTSTGVS